MPYSDDFIKALYHKLMVGDCSYEDFRQAFLEVYETVHGEDC